MASSAEVATARHRERRRPTSARRRILGWYIAILVMALGTGLLLQRSVLVAHVEREVEAELLQEAEEVRSLAAGIDPATGDPFGGDVAAIFDTFLSRNIPTEGEALFTLVAGRPYKSSVTPVQLFDDAALVAEWATATGTTWGETDTGAGRVRYLVTPLRDGAGVAGTFVVAMFMDDRMDRVDRAIRVGTAVFGSIFVLASATAWLAAGRVLRPIRLLTEASRSIDDTNWSTRIEVAGDEEVSELARTFNAMLDRLEAAFATQRRFIDDAGHELRTPITIIRGHLDLWAADPTEASESRTIIEDELDRMTRLVDDLLLLARAEHGDFLALGPVDVSVLVDAVGAKVRAFGDRPWTIAPGKRVVIVADEQRIMQAIMNLARNAVEHTREGTPIEIGATADAGSVRIWVRDHGQGIDPADLDTIFERFRRGGSGRRPTDGAGLGLAIVAAITEAHRGRVEVESRPGQGATFTMVLPIDQEGGIR